MRIVSPLSLCVLAAVLPAATRAEPTFAESSATLTITLTHPSSATTRDLSGGEQLVTTRLSRVRLGNRQILETLVAREIIPSIQGWRVVALWANWPDAEPYAGNAYRFFARRGKGANIETVAIPRDVLSVEPLSGAVAFSHRIANETTITTGTETFSVYHQATIASELFAGLAHGIETGTGRYIKQSGQTGGRYLPNSSKLALLGTFDAKDESTHGVLAGTVSYGTASLVPASLYAASTQGTTSVGAVLHNGSGTLTLSGSNTYTGGTTVTNGTLDLAGTGSIGGTLIGNGSNGTFAPGNSTGTLVMVNGGTMTLGTGQLLTFAPGETYDLATLSSEELTGASFTPFTLNPDGTLTTVPPAP